MAYCNSPRGIHFCGWKPLRSRWPRRCGWTTRSDIFDRRSDRFCSTPRRDHPFLVRLQNCQIHRLIPPVAACGQWYLEAKGTIHISFLWFGQFDHPKWAGGYFKAMLLGSSTGRSMMGLASSMRRMSRTSSTYGYRKNSSSYSFIFYLL